MEAHTSIGSISVSFIFVSFLNKRVNFERVEFAPNMPKEQIPSFLCRLLFRQGFLFREQNVVAHKLFPLINIIDHIVEIKYLNDTPQYQSKYWG